MSSAAGSGTLGIEVPDGVPDAIEAGASALRGISGVLERTGAAFAAGRPAGWTGSAAIGFGDRCTDEGVAATRAGEAMQLGARVLHDLAGDLRAAQRAARHEIAAARDAKARADRAREAAEQARTEATAARQSAAASAKRAALTEVVGATPAVGDRAAERSALARAGEADVARARHERSAAAADDDLATAQRRGRDLVRRYKETARQAGQMLAGLAAQAPVVSAVNGQPVAATGGPGRPPAVAPVTVSASPAPRATDKSDDDGGGLLGSIVHGGLDAIGLVPLLGEPADAVNGLIHTVEGNEVDAALSFAAVVPGVGMGATAAKYGRKGVNALEEGAQAPRGARRWTPGDDHYAPTATGRDPSWSAVRARYWKNVAHDPKVASLWDDANLERMQAGKAPQRFNPKKPGLESMELSHEPIPARDGGRNLVERWPQDHARIDPFRRPGY